MQTRPRQEQRAWANLQSLGVETFYPMLRRRSRSRRAGQAACGEPLFPNYLFTRCHVSGLAHSISYTRGVARLVADRHGPLPIDLDIIEAIQQRVGDDGFVDVQDALAEGDMVRINDGPLRNLVGVFERYVRPAERTAILVHVLSSRMRVVVDSGDVDRVGAEVRL